MVRLSFNLKPHCIMRHLTLALTTDGQNLQPLINLVRVIRPPRLQSVEWTVQRLEEIIKELRSDEILRNQWHTYIRSVLVVLDPLRTYTDLGILSNKGFLAETYDKISYNILPPAAQERELSYFLGKVFYKKDDFEWVAQVPHALWLELLEALGFQIQITAKHQEYILNAILVLAQRITAIGLEPEVVAKLPEMDDLQSPFLELNREVMHYVHHFKRNRAEYPNQNEEDYKHILVMLRQSEKDIKRLQKDKETLGISVELTYLILRLDQHLRRIRILLEIVQAPPQQVNSQKLLELLKELIEKRNTQYSLRRHFSDNLSYMAYKVVDNTSKRGEHYISTSSKEYWNMFKIALGGGFIVAFLACFKTLIYYWHLPPLGEAFMYSMNYSLGFILIHLMHFTLATKQPAMTASTIAASFGSGEKNAIQNTVQLIAQMVRTQFIALAGNVVMAFPAGLLLAWLFRLVMGHSIATPEKAVKLITELHPTHSNSVMYAAIAGVFLMTSGLISGLYENRVIYRNIPQRLREQPLLNKILSAKALDRFATYIGNNLGALAGNFYLGIFLGSMAAIGFIVGLPLDIRHVTFAAANVALAWDGTGFALSWHQALWVSLSVAAIGITNVIVSFGLSVIFALKSRNIDLRQMRLLIVALFKHFWKNPLAFFFPLKSSVKVKMQAT
ncbi:Site-specific recombinase [Flexibacter flexilis DSM 6793]|uniref:Site-specific recombinase n=2 Tax=Flexibacter flexilis TaxID=998 RepID=A0A1I1HMZ9_9BACT|nr:Site-specific recombinase [Flexibacter flexilis DSM 6793]